MIEEEIQWQEGPTTISPPDIEGPEAEVEEQLVAPVDDESEMPIEEEPDLVGATEEEVDFSEEDVLEEEEHLKRTLAEEQTAPAAVAKHTKVKHLPSLQSAEEAANKQPPTKTKILGPAPATMAPFDDDDQL